MALDQIANWTQSMADNLSQTLANTSLSAPDPASSNPPAPSGPVEWTTPSIYLPDELVLQIIWHVLYSTPATEAQYTLSAFCRLSHQWNNIATPLLYARPQLYGKNFDPFVRTICPSINARVRESPLASLVKELNMASLVHQGSKSLTARILGRVKGNIEVFVAPVASFALNCLPPLSKCHRLRALDLSLVSESPPLHNLFKTTAHLENLMSFRLPRSSGFGGQIQKPEQRSQPWPPRLRDLSLSGGIDGLFLHGVVGLPQSLQKLTIEHCPLIRTFELDNLLQRAVAGLPLLTDVSIRHLPRLSGNALDHLLPLLPQLRRLSISVDYISPAFFDFGPSPAAASHPFSAAIIDEKPRHQHQHLHHLELTTSSATNIDDKIAPVDVAFAIDEGRLPALRQVRVATALQWHHHADTKSDAEDLAGTLQDASRRDWEARAGVFARMSERDCRRTLDGQAPWERVAGVWMF